MYIPTVLCDSRPTTYIRLIDGALMADKGTGAWSFIDPIQYDEEHDGDRIFDEYHISVLEMLYTPEAFFETMNKLSKEPWFKPDKFFEFFGRFWATNEEYAKAPSPDHAKKMLDTHRDIR